MVVVIKNFEGTFPGGRIMTVRPSDPDATGRYQCRLLSGPDNIFTVEEDGCAVRAGRIQVLSLTQFYSIDFSKSRIGT